jgi:hypothetical protein
VRRWRCGASSKRLRSRTSIFFGRASSSRYLFTDAVPGPPLAAPHPAVMGTRIPPNRHGGSSFLRLPHLFGLLGNSSPQAGRKRPIGKSKGAGGRGGALQRYLKAYRTFSQSDCSLASLSSCGRNSSLPPPSRLTSKATYLSPPKRCVIVPSRPSKAGLLRHSRTRTRVPRRRSSGPVKGAPLRGIWRRVVLTFVGGSGLTERHEALRVPGLPSCILSRSPVVALRPRPGALWDDRDRIWPVVLVNPFRGIHGVLGVLNGAHPILSSCSPSSRCFGGP